MTLCTLTQQQNKQHHSQNLSLLHLFSPSKFWFLFHNFELIFLWSYAPVRTPLLIPLLFFLPISAFSYYTTVAACPLVLDLPPSAMFPSCSLLARLFSNNLLRYSLQPTDYKLFDYFAAILWSFSSFLMRAPLAPAFIRLILNSPHCIHSKHKHTQLLSPKSVTVERQISSPKSWHILLSNTLWAQGFRLERAWNKIIEVWFSVSFLSATTSEYKSHACQPCTKFTIQQTFISLTSYRIWFLLNHSMAYLLLTKLLIHTLLTGALEACSKEGLISPSVSHNAQNRLEKVAKAIKLEQISLLD